MDGRVLSFRLIGINNQNFLMEDLETRSWWQQITGRAIQGPLKGRALTPVLHDEVTFGLWKREHPQGRVLALDAQKTQISANWESRVAKAPVVTAARAGDRLEPRALVIGLVLDGQARAYPRDVLKNTRVILDEVAGVPLAIVTGGDGTSVRVFDRRIDDRTLDLHDRIGSSPARFLDPETGTEWDISGTAVSGPRAGRTLTRLPFVSDFWFDWRTHRPQTTVYVAR